MVFVHFVQCLMFLLIIYLLIIYTVPPIEKCATIFKLHTFSVVFYRKHSSSVAAYRTFEMIERRLSVTNLSSENNFANVSTECSSHLQGESERSVKQRCYL